MVTPTTGAPTGDAPTTQLDELAAELRRIYTQAFKPTLEAVTKAQRRFEAPDGAGTVDPIYAADTAGCQAVNDHLAQVVARHLPGATLLAGIDEPAVIDSCWLHETAVVVIEWDHSYDFGDPDALIVRELGQ